MKITKSLLKKLIILEMKEQELGEVEPYDFIDATISFNKSVAELVKALKDTIKKENKPSMGSFNDEIIIRNFKEQLIEYSNGLLSEEIVEQLIKLWQSTGIIEKESSWSSNGRTASVQKRAKPKKTGSSWNVQKRAKPKKTGSSWKDSLWDD